MLLVNFLFLSLILKINCEDLKLKEPITIHKCCSETNYINVTKEIPRHNCTSLKDSKFTKVVIYDNKFNALANESLETAFNVTAGMFANRTFRQRAKLIKNRNWYLTKEFGLIMEIPNIYNRLIPINNSSFCYDYTKDEHNKLVPRFWVDLKEDSVNESGVLLTTAMLVSSVFLLIVLIVYGLLSELRNLCGLILMAYVSSLIGAFVLLASMRLMTSHDTSSCIKMTCAIYFFFMATFCWMNVMSYDIWWTFRGYAKARPIHRKGEMFKFAMYSIYGYGVPLVMTIFLRVINEVDLTHVPWFIKPGIPDKGCFIMGGQKLVYLYIPMMILILSNWLFYLMTAFNVWRLNHDTAVLDSDAAAGIPAAHRSNRQRFLVYLKLSVVMGLSWVLEVVSFLVPSLDNIWWISDAYNMLIGVIIFVIFVCKPTILKKLKRL